MPNYSYGCNKCNKVFELFFYFKDYVEKPQCIHCKSPNTERLVVLDAMTLNASVKKSDSELKTIGDLADRNRDRMSNDQKTELYTRHNSYKETTDEAPLPKGMTRMKKGQKTIWPK